jgi:hypothetical protein
MKKGGQSAINMELNEKDGQLTHREKETSFRVHTRGLKSTLFTCTTNARQILYL